MTVNIRLNKDMRLKIRNRLIAHKFDPIEKALREDEHLVALILYYRLVTSEMEQKMKTLPADWFPTLKEIRVTFPLSNPKISTATRSNYFWLKERMPVPHYVILAYPHMSLVHRPEDEKLIAKCNELLDRKNKIAKDRNDLCAEIYATLSSVQGTQKLLEIWPEVEPFLWGGEEPPKKIVTLPVAMTTALNKKLDLPIEDK